MTISVRLFRLWCVAALLTAGCTQTVTGASCGRDYRVQSVVLVEVTFCGFPESVPDIVMSNILGKLPS